MAKLRKELLIFFFSLKQKQKEEEKKGFDEFKKKDLVQQINLPLFQKI